MRKKINQSTEGLGNGNVVSRQLNFEIPAVCIRGVGLGFLFPEQPDAPRSSARLTLPNQTSPDRSANLIPPGQTVLFRSANVIRFGQSTSGRTESTAPLKPSSTFRSEITIPPRQDAIFRTEIAIPPRKSATFRHNHLQISKQNRSFLSETAKTTQKHLNP